MATGVNRYNKGLNKDLAKSKFSPENYYHAENFKVVTAGGLSTGVLENTKGTSLQFTIPTVPAANYEASGEVPVSVPEQTNPKIIGFANYDSYLIIFTTTGNGYLQIWRVEYNESTGSLIGLSSSSLVVATHLIYNRYMNVSEDNRIKAFVRKETSKFIRLYWVDGGRNPMRTLNIAKSITDILNTPVRTIDMSTEVKLKVPMVKELLQGDLPTGRISYFYRLVSKDGAITPYSPLTPPIDLIPGNEAGIYGQYPEEHDETKTDDIADAAKEQRAKFTSDKAVKVYIDSVDKDYDYIQVGYVLWKVKDVPEIYLFPEQPLLINGSNKELTFIHSGNEGSEFPITITDLNSLLNTFDNPKTFTAKQNILYVANTQNEQFDIDFDARAYRYKSDGTTTYVTLPLAETDDAINPFNDENPSTNANWAAADQYKFQTDGLTLGGEGTNVTYSFVIHEHVVDQDVVELVDGGNIDLVNPDVQEGAPFSKVLLETDATYTPSFTPYSGATYTSIDKSYSDLKSPYKAQIFGGFARGEVYRFGIVFVDKKGRSSFVKWIGDIKFPFHGDSDAKNTSYAIDRYDLATNTYYVRTLGIEFDIALDADDILANISGMYIVYVQREEEDRSRLGTGITGSFFLAQNQRFDFADFQALLTAIIKEAIKGVIPKGPFGGFFDFSWFGGADQLWDNIADHITAAVTDGYSTSRKGIFEQNASPETIRTIIKQMISTAGSAFSGGSVMKIFVGAFGDQFAEFIADKVYDYFQREVGNIDTLVYALNGNPDTTDNYSGTAGTVDTVGVIQGKDYGYVIAPHISFDKYKFKPNDYVKILKKYEFDLDNVAYPKMVAIYHRATDVGVLNRVHSTAAYRKWYNGQDYDDPTDSTLKRTIEFENVLDQGEILKPNQITGLPDGTFVNAFIGFTEKYQDNGNYIGNTAKFSFKYNVFGIGDKKHFIKVGSAFPAADLLNNYTVYDQQGTWDATDDKYYGLIASRTGSVATGHVFATPGAVAPGTVDTGDSVSPYLEQPRLLDCFGDYMVSYERYLTDQYGGNTYEARSLNKYIPLAFVPINGLSTTNNLIVYGGDTYVGLFDAVNYGYYFEALPGYEPAKKTKKALGELVACEAPFNFNVREGKHFNKSQDTDDLDQTEKRVKRKLRRAKRRAKRTGIDYQKAAEIIIPKRFIFDEFKYNDCFHQQPNVKLFLPEPAIDVFVDKAPVRIWKSMPKLDGELIDQWKLFKALDFLDVEGIYGEINELTVQQDRLFFYQDNAFGVATTNERATAATDTGSLAIASSNPLSRFDYVSTETGCKHRFGVVTTNHAIFHFDVNKKKLYKYGGQGLEPLTDVEGMSSYFRSVLATGNIIDQDKTLATTPYGIHGFYDPEYNTVFYTFLNGTSKFTISYNLMLQAFESFHSFTPGIYHRTNRRSITANPSLPSNCHTLFTGNYNEYFGTDAPSIITVISAEAPGVTKTFDNITYYSECKNSLGADQQETFTKIQCTTDYQDSGVITLTNNSNIKRKERAWHLQVPRDAATPAYTSLKARLRDFYLMTSLTYDNSGNNRLVVHDIHTDFRQSIT